MGCQVKMFKAQKDTNRFRKNQKVWIKDEYANYLSIRYRYRGRGRYVSGFMAKWASSYDGWSSIIGDEGLKTIVVDYQFAKRHGLVENR